MKKLLSILCLFLAIYANAQTPQAINYQGVARDNNGNVIATHLVALRLSILSGSTSGSTVYVETHSKTTDANGLFSLQIGQGTSITGTFSSITWGSNSHYLKVEIDPAGGTNYQLAGITQFSAVPYALNAANGMPEGQNYGDLLFWNDTTWVTIQHGSVGQVLTLNSSNKPVWQTPPANVLLSPQLTTTAVSSITNNTASSGGNITSDGGYVINDRGVCWAIGTTPTISDNKTSNGTGGGSFTSNLTGLLGNTTYNVRAFATNSVGTGYGLTLSFTTAPPTLAVLSTTVASNITGVTATSGGNITSSGGALITARGVCWSKISSYPTIADSKTTDSIGSGVFVSNITGLLPGTTYYVRAYATNSVGTAYGQSNSFTTSIILPTLTTTALSEITPTTAKSGGNIITVGGNYNITARGVCWSTSANPSIALTTKTSEYTGIGIYTSSITGLAAGTTYYVRAYATNSAGTVYGNELTFTTLPPSLATLTTNPVSNIASTVAISGGYISNNGGSAITAQGICWSTSANPTVSLSTKTIDISGSNSFINNIITGLTPGTTYNVRAYATNSSGTAYGNQLTFTTSTQLGIGDPHQGGIVAYIFQGEVFFPNPFDPNGPPTWIPGDPGYVSGEVHGIIAAPYDQSTSVQWGCEGIEMLTSCQFLCNHVGHGSFNTDMIVNGCSTPGIAARICSNLVLNGYSDWFLPDIIELSELFANKLLIGGFDYGYYWSSTESDYNNYNYSPSNYAWIIHFSNGGQERLYKSTGTGRVRAIRNF